MSSIAELAEDRVVEGVYAVARKRRLRTKNGSAYLALELVDPSGRIEGRVWNDVDLLDARFGEGDAVRVLGRVERYRDRLQLDVRSIEPEPEADPAGFAPAMRRDPDELDGFLEFLAAEIVASGAEGDRRPVRRATPRSAAGCGRSRPPRTAITTTRAACSSTRSASRRSAASCASSTRASAPICCSRPRCSTTSAAPPSSSRGPGFRQTGEGRLLGHVHLGVRG